MLIGHSAALSGASLFGNQMPSLTGVRLIPRPIPNASFSRYSCSLSLQDSMVIFLLMMFLALLHRFGSIGVLMM